MGRIHDPGRGSAPMPNIGYMGPGSYYCGAGLKELIVPYCADLRLRQHPAVHARAVHDGAGQLEKMNVGATAWYVVKERRHAPVQIATAVAVTAAYFRFVPPALIDAMISFLKNAAAPCALFTMGVTVALRPLKRVPFRNARADGHQDTDPDPLAGLGSSCPGLGISVVNGPSRPCHGSPCRRLLNVFVIAKPVSGLCRAGIDGHHGGNP